MNILGIDYGVKNIGLAWCQVGLDVVLPFGSLNSDQKIVNNLVTLINEEGIDKVVVGLPVGLDGEENENTERVRGFVDELKGQIDISIEFVDERYSSKQADKMFDPVVARSRSGYKTHGGMRQVREAKKSSRDERSAMVVLQYYLDKNAD